MGLYIIMPVGYVMDLTICYGGTGKFQYHKTYLFFTDWTKNDSTCVLSLLCSLDLNIHVF